MSNPISPEMTSRQIRAGRSPALREVDWLGIPQAPRTRARSLAGNYAGRLCLHEMEVGSVEIRFDETSLGGVVMTVTPRRHIETAVVGSGVRRDLRASQHRATWLCAYFSVFSLPGPGSSRENG